MLDSSRDTDSYIQVLKYRNDDLAIIANLERRMDITVLLGLT